MNLLPRLLEKWTAWVLSRPRFVFGIVIVITVACAVLTFLKLDMQTDELELISKDHPLLRLSDRLEPFKEKASFSVVIQAPTPQRAVDFLHKLVPLIEQDTAHFKEVSYRVDIDTIKRWGLLYLDEDDLLQLRSQLNEYPSLIEGIASRPDLVNFLSLMNKEMASRMVGELFTGFLGDEGEDKQAGGRGPMDLGFLVQSLDVLNNYLHGNPVYNSPWAAFFKNETWDLSIEGYFWVADKRYLVILVSPNKLEDSFTWQQESLQKLRDVIREVRTGFPDVEVGVTGKTAINTDEMTIALSDMAWATWFSMVGVFLLRILFRHSTRRPVIEMIALSIGICWAFGWTTLFIGHLNILSLVFAPMLIGLGDDFSVHWFARFEEEERVSSADQREIIMSVTRKAGPGIIHAGLSTAFTFFPFVLTGFRGLMELGIISGMGILFILLADFTLLPILGLWQAGRQNGKIGRGLFAYGGDLLSFSGWSARLALLVVGIISAISLWGALKVSFDINPLRLQSQNAESVVWEKKIMESSSRSTLYAAVVVDSIEDVKARSKALKALPEVSDVESVLTLLPENQEQKITIIREILPDIPNIEATGSAGVPMDMQSLADILQRIRFKMQEEQASEWGAEGPLPEQMARARVLIASILEALKFPDAARRPLMAFQHKFMGDLVNTMDFLRQGASTTPMRIEDIPRDMRERYQSDGHYLIRVYPTGSVWQEESLGKFINAVWSVDREAVGEPVSLYVFASAFRHASMQASIYALGAIFIILIIPFRSVGLTLLGLLPLAVGTLWTVGIMGFSGVDFNLANSIFVPLVFGAGVEYAVVILHRWREGGMESGHLPFSTGKGVILAALTTTIGFGTLMISHHRGIFSLGFVAWAGSLCILLAALILLPAIMAITESLVPQSTVRKGEVE